MLFACQYNLTTEYEDYRQHTDAQLRQLQEATTDHVAVLERELKEARRKASDAANASVSPISARSRSTAQAWAMNSDVPHPTTAIRAPAM